MVTVSQKREGSCTTGKNNKILVKWGFPNLFSNKKLKLKNIIKV